MLPLAFVSLMHTPTHVLVACRLGNTEVTQGNENAPCTQSLTISAGYTLPVQCLGTGRYLTLWVQRAQASTMYICEIYVYLAGQQWLDHPTQWMFNL